METSFVQRWRQGRQSYRPAGEVIVPTEYEVAAISAKEAKAFVLEHHYLSRSHPACRFRFGLFRRNRLAGVAVFSHPCNDQVLSSIFGGAAIESVELGRFVLLDEVPANGESWFLSRCLKTLRREHLRGVLSFCDPMPRTSADGRIVHKGHIGVVYAATSGVYTGRSTSRTLRLLPDGNILSERDPEDSSRGERVSLRKPTTRSVRGSATDWQPKRLAANLASAHYKATSPRRQSSIRLATPSGDSKAVAARTSLPKILGPARHTVAAAVLNPNRTGRRRRSDRG